MVNLEKYGASLTSSCPRSDNEATLYFNKLGDYVQPHEFICPGKSKSISGAHNTAICSELHELHEQGKTKKSPNCPLFLDYVYDMKKWREINARRKGEGSGLEKTTNQSA